MYYNPYAYSALSHPYPIPAMSNHTALTPLPHPQAMPSQNNPFPPVNTHQLKDSAKNMQDMMDQSQFLTNKITESEQFALDLMNAAQRSKKEEVDNLITSTGITSKFESKFTPDGIQIRFTEHPCCRLTLVLGW